jgi:hypothetical protein
LANKLLNNVCNRLFFNKRDIQLQQTIRFAVFPLDCSLHPVEQLRLLRVGSLTVTDSPTKFGRIKPAVI